METKVESIYEILKNIIDSEFEKAIIVTLFKNKTKCEYIVGKIKVANNGNRCATPLKKESTSC